MRLRLLLHLPVVAMLAPAARAQEGPDDSTRNPSISDDGRFVAFDTRAQNFFPGDDLGTENVFWMDRETRRVYNAQSAGQHTYGGGAVFPQISNDGNWITFQSSNQFIEGATTTNIYVSAVRSRTRGLAPAPKFRRISRNASGESGNGVCNYPTISANGRFIAYMSKATNLTGDAVPADVTQIYRHDRDFDEDGVFDETDPGATQTILVSRSGAGPGDDDSQFPTISGDGQTILFSTEATNLPAGVVTTRMRVWKDGSVAGTNGVRRGLTPDGGITVSRNRVYPAGVPENVGTFYRYKNDQLATIGFPDRGGGDVPTTGARFVLTCTDHPIDGADTNGTTDVYLLDRLAKTATLISTGPNGTGNGASGSRDYNDAYIDISPDGRFIAYATRATDLGFEDNNDGNHDVIIVDRESGEQDRVEVDVTPPAWPGAMVEVSEISDQSARFEWNAATDRGGIDYYAVDLGGDLPRSAGKGTARTITGLVPNTTYTATMKAFDASGNESTGATATFKTLPETAVDDTFVITGWAIGRTTSVTVRSEPGATYVLEYSADAVSWIALEAGIPSHGRYTPIVVETPAWLPEAALIRVRKQ